jgi:hypothetical protein
MIERLVLSLSLSLALSRGGVSTRLLVRCILGLPELDWSPMKISSSVSIQNLIYIKKGIEGRRRKEKEGEGRRRKGKEEGRGEGREER